MRLWLRLNEYRLAPRLLLGANRCFHYLYPENSLFAGLRWRRDHKLVVTWHQPLSYLQELPEVFRAHAQSILKQATAVVFLTDEAQREHVSALGLTNSHYIKHGVDTDFFEYSEGTLSKPYINILTVGNWLRDHRCWAETVGILLRRNPMLRFTVLCNRRNRELFQSHLTERPDQIRFLEGLDDAGLRNLYRDADIAFLPLLAATANNSLLECMASGVPIVVSDLQATREYAKDSAVYFGNRSAVAAAESILDLAGSRSRRVAIARSARVVAERDLSWQVIARRFGELYSDLQ
jgi:glycosyltransferase involved in cell wall biosynthesis